MIANRKVIIIIGSKSDLEFASSITSVLKEYGVPYELNIASAHRTPEHLLKILKEYEYSGYDLVYITVAGLSDALSGVVAGRTAHPIIACPPDYEKYGVSKMFSSVMTPKGVPVLFTPMPENAALAAIRILALSNDSLRRKIERNQKKKEREIIKFHYGESKRLRVA